MVDNCLILSLKSTRELSNCRPLEFVQSLLSEADTDENTLVGQPSMKFCTDGLKSM